MKASIVDLRYKTKEVLEALDRNEIVSILYRGKLKGKILPAGRTHDNIKVVDHPLFGSHPDDKTAVEDVIGKIRSPRY